MGAVPGSIEWDKQPPMTVPLRHFLVGIGFLLAGALLGVGIALDLTSAWARLSHVHLLLAGWVCVTIMGATTQFVPVWSGVELWAYRSFIDRLAATAEEYGITVGVESEAYTTAECPVCGERDDTNRHGDVFRCSCGYEGHADLDASRTFLERQAGEHAVRPMARPVRLTWDDHVWSESPRSPERARPNEERTHRSTREGKLASVGTT